MPVDSDKLGTNVSKKSFFRILVAALPGGLSLSERVARDVKRAVQDKNILTTEVIRDGGFIHGRMTPVLKKRPSAGKG